ARFYTWLYRIAMNAAVGLLRKRLPVSSGMSPHGEWALDPEDLSEAAQPDRGLEQAERITEVQQALARLSPEHRAVLVFKDVEGMKYEEMAEVLGIRIGTVRSRLHRARLELRALLE